MGPPVILEGPVQTDMLMATAHGEARKVGRQAEAFKQQRHKRGIINVIPLVFLNTGDTNCQYPVGMSDDKSCDMPKVIFKSTFTIFMKSMV